MNAKTTALLAVLVAVFASAVFIMDAGDSDAADSIEGQGFNHEDNYDMTVEYHEVESSTYYLKIDLTAINTSKMVNVFVGDKSYGPFPASTSFNVFLPGALTGTNPITIAIKEATNTSTEVATCDIILDTTSAVSLDAIQVAGASVTIDSTYTESGTFTIDGVAGSSISSVKYGSTYSVSDGILTIIDTNGQETTVVPVPDISSNKYTSNIGTTEDSGWFVKNGESSYAKITEPGTVTADLTLTHKFLITYKQYEVTTKIVINNVTGDKLADDFVPGTLVATTTDLATVKFGDAIAMSGTSSAAVMTFGTGTTRVLTATPSTVAIPGAPSTTNYVITVEKWQINGTDVDIDASSTTITDTIVNAGKVEVTAVFNVDYPSLTVTIEKSGVTDAIGSLLVDDTAWSDTHKTITVKYNSVANVNEGTLTFVNQAGDSEGKAVGTATASTDTITYAIAWTAGTTLIGAPIQAACTFTLTGSSQTAVLQLASVVFVESSGSYSTEDVPTVALNSYIYKTESAVLKITAANGHAYIYQFKAVAYNANVTTENVGKIGKEEAGAIPVIEGISVVKQNGSVYSVTGVSQSAKIVVICTEVAEAANVKQFYVSDIGEATIGAVIESKDAAFDAGEIRLSYSYYRTIGSIEGYGSADKAVLNCTSDKDYNGTAIALTETTPTLTSGSYHDMTFTATGTVYAAKALYGTTSGTFSPVAETLWVFAGVKDI